jgi:hypothetical protein
MMDTPGLPNRALLKPVCGAESSLKHREANRLSCSPGAPTSAALTLCPSAHQTIPARGWRRRHGEQGSGLAFGVCITSVRVPRGHTPRCRARHWCRRGVCAAEGRSCSRARGVWSGSVRVCSVRVCSVRVLRGLAGGASPQVLRGRAGLRFQAPGPIACAASCIRV